MARCKVPAISMFLSWYYLIAITCVAACGEDPLETFGIHRRHDDLSAKGILDKSIEALGGQSALDNLKTVSSHAFIWRSFSIAESNVPGVADTGISVAGEQTISYDLSDPTQVVQRIDRKDVLGDYWTFQRTLLEIPESSLVVRSGQDGYACFVDGNEFLFAPPEAPFGYVDPFFAYILVRDAWRFSPAIVRSLQASTGTLATSMVQINDARLHPAVTDDSLNLTVIFDPETYLPARVRAYEDHPILGPSTNDVLLYNYTMVDGISLPQNIKLLYNEDLMLQEIQLNNFKINPSFPPTQFQGLPPAITNQTVSGAPPSPALYPEFATPAQIFEFSQNFFYAGPYSGTLPALKVVKPIDSLPNLYHLTFKDNTVYRTVVAVFDDAIMVTDAPPQQSHLVIQWVQETFNRSVTHLLVTHHHHDHNLGAEDYVAIGAKLVVPERFTYYWQQIKGVEFMTASLDRSEEQPFTHSDGKMQVHGIWHAVDAHSADWMYFTFTTACASADAEMGIVTADAWSPGVDPFGYGQRPVLQWLAIARMDGVPKEHTELPIHGDPQPASKLYPEIGYEYPEYTVGDFLGGACMC
ncbi:uncharacterized protein LTR77_011057 [Saxophila tyrrhenica]|uniref:Metallo-beta-lactamase domain-containing protein n=1 Tax=Saxophila tyrrhenica TaxID=1690608 RepID=A0AAV9NTV1_9PEZI|nr:hypothetical protein LTR77_011057 [Saxophila tyrrhenica]